LALIKVAVCGAHLAGLPLNGQLTSRGATLTASTHTAPHYRLFALPGGPVRRPGLVRDTNAGAAIDVEVWELPIEEFGSFVANIPAPLGIGKVQLADASWCCGFICEGAGIEGAEEVTHLGGWRAFLNSSNQ
jgi:allophanate hydrolase